LIKNIHLKHYSLKTKKSYKYGHLRDTVIFKLIHLFSFWFLVFIKKKRREAPYGRGHPGHGKPPYVKDDGRWEDCKLITMVL